MTRQYTITYYGEKSNHIGTLPCPDVLPTPKTILEVQEPFFTLAGHEYRRGTKLLLLQRTNKTPHNRLSSLGNWEVQCPFGVSIWANIEYSMAKGYLKVWQ